MHAIATTTKVTSRFVPLLSFPLLHVRSIPEADLPDRWLTSWFTFADGMLRSLKLEQIHSVERVKHSGLIYTEGKQRSKDNVHQVLYFEVLL